MENFFFFQYENDEISMKSIRRFQICAPPDFFFFFFFFFLTEGIF